MSYDIDIADRSFNYTFNVSKVFYDHIPDTGKGGGFRELVGLNGSQAVPILSAAFTALNATRHSLWKDGQVGEPEMSERYDAKNGWGSLIGAIILLGEILGASAMNPYADIQVSM